MRITVFDKDYKMRFAEALERNGNLTLVQYENGEQEWLSPHEIEGRGLVAGVRNATKAKEEPCQS